MFIFDFKSSAISVAVAAFLSPVVSMADVNGGGATLPARAYFGANASASATGPRLSTVPSAGSLFGEALTTAAQSYCQVGSSNGLRVITGNNNNDDASRPCPTTFTDAFVNGASGFSTLSDDADYAGSDAPAGTSQFNGFLVNKAEHTQLTQFPSIAGFIGVIANTPFNDAAQVYFTEAEVCNIFNGRITNWNQLARGSGAPWPSRPITIVYRSDGSGTSFAFSNHLNRVCQDGALAQNLNAAARALPFNSDAGAGPVTNFTVQQTFAAAFPGGVVPTNSASASGNPGVISAVDATDGAIGYAEAANAIAIASPNVRLARIAPVDQAAELDPATGANPARQIPAYLSPAPNAAVFTVPDLFEDLNGETYSGVYAGRALQGNNARYGRPVGLPTALTATQAPFPNCVFIVHPGAYATSLYRSAGQPSSGYRNYPIAGVTYLLGNYAGNGANEADVETVLGSPYNVPLRAAVNTVGANTGYAYLSFFTATPLAEGGAAVSLNQNRINSCVR